MVLALVRDLLFASKITSTARARNINVKVIRDPSQLSAEPGTRLLVDLSQAGALEAAIQWKIAHGGEVIGFVSHVDAETISRARESGVDQVLARGQCTQQLDQLLQ